MLFILRSRIIPFFGLHQNIIFFYSNVSHNFSVAVNSKNPTLLIKSVNTIIIIIPIYVKQATTPIILRHYEKDSRRDLQNLRYG